MIKTVKATKIAIFDNSQKKYTKDWIKKITGCDYIINGGYFNMNNLKPVTHLKVDGIIKVTDQYKYYGYAFNTNSQKFSITTDYSLYDNYFCGVCMIKDGKKQTMYYNSDVGGKRGRSAIGQTKNGEIVLYCTKDGSSETKTPEQLQDYFYNLGVDSAIMLDSGGSSQCDFKGSTINSSRIVSNFILVWEEIVVQPVTTTWTPGYTEPSTNISNGSKGEGASWVQSMLRKIGFQIEVDGIFGSNSVSALKTFQKYWSLDVDGICGTNTRASLKNCIHGMLENTKAMVNVTTSEIARTESAGQDDKYINWYNKVMGTNFSTSVAWCAIFMSWCMRRAGIDEKKYPNFSSCSAGSKVFNNNGVLKDKNNYSPKSGDLVFFDWNYDGLPDHVGMVFSNDGTYIQTIEGNSGNAVKHNKYALNSKYIYKYVQLY